MNYELKTGCYIDFHTHHPSLRGERVIQDGVDTRGRHPWYLQSSTPSSFPLSPSSLVAVGESGLDRLCSTPYELQLSVFREEVALSESLGKPLFLHCVRAIDDVLRIRRELQARQPIIWHGYRGGARQMLQLLPHGFYFSYGIRYRAEALRQCPLDRLLLETDDDVAHPIADHYAEVASVIDIALDALIRQLQDNYTQLFA